MTAYRPGSEYRRRDGVLRWNLIKALRSIQSSSVGSAQCHLSTMRDLEFLGLVTAGGFWSGANARRYDLSAAGRRELFLADQAVSTAQVIAEELAAEAAGVSL